MRHLFADKTIQNLKLKSVQDLRDLNSNVMDHTVQQTNTATEPDV